MINSDIKLNSERETRFSFVCFALCGILFLVLSIAPKIPSTASQMFKPLFIVLCLLTMPYSRYYKLSATKYHLVSLVYYSAILISFKITKSSVITYASMALFIVFFLLAGNRQWTKRELAWVIIAVIVACDIQSLIILYCNHDMLRNSSSSHLDFIGTVVNRNPVAFAVVPGTLCSMFAFLYDKRNESVFRKAFYLLSCLICSLTVFMIGCRSAFFSAAAGLFCIVWQKAKEARNHEERFGQKVFVIVLVLVVLFSAVYVSQGTYSSRLFDFSENANNSGRDVLWEDAWELIDQKPVFGGGYDWWGNTGHTMGTHNSFLTIMVCSGWIGGIILGLFFLALCFEILKTRNLIPLAFIVEAFLHSWTEPGMDYYAYIPLLLSVVFLRFVQYKSKDFNTLFAW